MSSSSFFLCLPLLLLSACQNLGTEEAPEGPWLAIAQNDPLLGGGQSFEDRLVRDPRINLSREKPAQQTFLRAMRTEHDRHALALAEKLFPEPLATAVAAFIDSEAGSAYVRAELFALSGYPYHDVSFPCETAIRFASRAEVGQLAMDRFAELQRAMAKGAAGSVSPVKLSYLVAGIWIEEDQADAIRGFFASEIGRQWIEVRSQAMRDMRKRFMAFRASALDLGVAVPNDPSLFGLPLTYQMVEVSMTGVGLRNPASVRLFAK